MKKFLSVLLVCSLLLSCFAFSASAKEKTDAKLQFGADGKFRILNFADTQDDSFFDKSCAMFLKDSVEATKPDLVVISGDCISGGSNPMKFLGKASINKFMKIFDKLNVPVAIVYGNHDSEGALSKEEMMAYYETFDCFVGCEGEDLTGCGTYNLPILSSDGSKVTFNLWLFDSLTYNGGDHKDSYPETPDNGLGGYGCVKPDQIQWYVRTSNALKEANGGKPVPSIAFQHIIVPEIWDALEECAEGTPGSCQHGGKFYKLPEGAKGKIGETPCPPNYSNGQFGAMVEQGDVIAFFTGHDHTNTMEVNYKGIDLVSTPGAGFQSYGDADRGARIIDLNENGTYTTSLLKWREFYDADNNEMADARFTMSGSEFEFGLQFKAFFKYIFKFLFGQRITPVTGVID